MTNITFHYDANAASGSSSGSIVGPYNGNGTAWMVKDFTPSTSDGSSPSCLRAFEDTLYFAGNWGTKVLWKTDGTESGTVKVQDSVNYNPPGNPCDLTVFDNSLYFRAQGYVPTSHGYELWKTDGTASGTVLVKDIRSGSSSSSPNGFRAVGDTLYFYADDGTHGYELWKTDGTASGTVMVKDINSGSGHSSNSQGIIPSFVAIGDTIYFIANDGINGRELWKSDGT
ncbi:MAG: ELWxxDGT repeat protein, partial [Candidatus Poseidoniaceae archaeon]